MGHRRQPVAKHPTPPTTRRRGARRPHSGRSAPYAVEVLGVGSAATVSGSRDERIARVAELQRGHITRAQLLAVGITNATIGRLVAAQRLIRVHPTVYAVRPIVPVPLAQEAAALLACSPNALLSHASAATLWKLCDPADGLVDVTVARYRHRQTPGIRVHRTGHLLPRDARVVDGLPVTSPARTLLDRAAALRHRELEREVDEALVVLEIVTGPELEDVLDRANGHHGAAALRRLLDRRVHETVTHSEAERLFLRLIREAGLPEPETQVKLEGFTVDFLWREPRVVFEIDGYRFHTSRRAFDRDRRKDLVLKRAGFDPNRVSRDQVKHEPLAVVAHVAAAVRTR